MTTRSNPAEWDAPPRASLVERCPNCGFWRRAAGVEVAMNWSDDVQFPKRYRPLPPGYRIVQLDSGHFLWTWGTSAQVAVGDYEEGLICWDRFWVRRCVFANHKQRIAPEAK